MFHDMTFTIPAWVLRTGSFVGVLTLVVGVLTLVVLGVAFILVVTKK